MDQNFIPVAATGAQMGNVVPMAMAASPQYSAQAQAQPMAYQQGTTPLAMQPGIQGMPQSNVIQFPVQQQQAGMQQAYTPPYLASMPQASQPPTQDQAWQTVREALQLLGQNGRVQSPSQVAQFSPQAMPPQYAPIQPLLPQQQGYPNQFQAYPQASPQFPQTSLPTQAYSPSTYPLSVPNSQALGSQSQGQQNNGFATIQELQQYFGSAEVAADNLNKYACQLEDYAELRDRQLGQLFQHAQELQGKNEQYVELLTVPEKTAEWYLYLEQLYGELPGFQQGQTIDVQPQYPSQQAFPPQIAPQQGFPQQGFPQQGFDATSGGVVNSTIANQMYNSLNRGVQGMPDQQLRQQFPQIPVGAGGQALPPIEAIPANQRHNYIDQLQSMGAFKNARLNALVG
ncbi:hypothetical protein K9N68_37195 (plasmid) [Kovacikia minuta CCNUW1]|uniref:hypothetical protein n=1 Tax=Kovacikia minuta TaxID=2931930 RepID=UPI001CCFEF20|nr:hypothetical protein [Kovacikia minuta]UBF29849.1 hypothetical protein K9N68_37195 [Kovacikia minuta CCNUW1]